MGSLESLVARVRAEYREMPGLRLTFGQACRLWHLDASACETVLEHLIREAFLYKTDNGDYIAVSGMVGRQAKAPLQERRRFARSA
jgi:hypothetical protein